MRDHEINACTARVGMECPGCPLAPQRWRFSTGTETDLAVFGRGSFESGIAFIGEAPGETEVANGEPLCGPVGWWFRNLLLDAGLTYERVYRTNALLCQASGSGSTLRGSEWHAVKHCAKSLLHETEWLIDQGIKVFVVMGNAALKSLMPSCPYPITQARGYVFDHPTQPGRAWVIPTLHPSPKNLKGKTMDGWVLIVNDFAKARRIAMRGAPYRKPYTRILNPSLGDIADFCRNPPFSMAVDVENTQTGRLVMVGFCDGSRTLVVPFLKQFGEDYWQGTTERVVKDLIGGILDDPGIEKIMQNGVHDCTILAMNQLPVRGWTHDTMLSHAACYPDQLHSLHHLGSMFSEGPPWKPPKQRTETTEPESTK
jgi:uracil-DNA glycosylase family 4